MATANPQRTCIGCQVVTSASDLERLVLDTTTWQVRIDRFAPGRGAWLCPTAFCLEAAIERKGLHRSYRCDVPPSVLNQLRDLWPYEDGDIARSNTKNR